MTRFTPAEFMAMYGWNGQTFGFGFDRWDPWALSVYRGICPRHPVPRIVHQDAWRAEVRVAVLKAMGRNKEGK